MFGRESVAIFFIQVFLTYCMNSVTLGGDNETILRTHRVMLKFSTRAMKNQGKYCANQEEAIVDPKRAEVSLEIRECHEISDSDSSKR